jgi:peptidoglycan/LPS O-acetylase OafA/YrhL
MIKYTYRPDIDGLRALAVLSVIFFHAFPNLISGGFIGVDIFFVISGFLITTIILENLKSGPFSLIEFYGRRIRRIFPALFLVLLACYAFGWFALYASEYRQLGKHIAAGATFLQNFVLWSESGYFDNSSDTKPLVHLWSLSIEVQLYIFWPLLLGFIFKNNLNVLKVVLLIITISFLVNILTIVSNPIAAFYNPLSRFWELLIGAVWAYMALSEKGIANKLSTRYSNSLSVAGLFLIALAICVLNKKSEFPGWWGLLPTLGSLFLIASGKDAFVNKKIFSSKLMVWFGLISYPLYLWHWPLISFGQIITSGKLTALYKIILIIISIALAYITYRYWERLLRHKGNIVTLILLFLVALVGTQGWSTYVRNGLEFREKHVLDLHGGRPPQSDEGCLKMLNKYQPTFCMLSNATQKLETVLIGDSIAHNEYSGLAKKYSEDEKSFAMVGWPGRQPLVKVPSDKNYDPEQSEQMNKLINGIAEDKDIKTVMLSMNQPEISELITTQLRRTIEFFQTRNKKVIFIYPPPYLTFDPIECIGFPPFRRVLNVDCYQKVNDINGQYFSGRKEINKIINESKIKSFDTYPQVCSEQSCQIKINGWLLYRTRGYLTIAGSEYVFQSFME